MSEVLKRYPVRATKFCKEVHSEGRKSRRTIRAATKAALRATNGPLLEVGGPSSKGYLAVDGLKLPNGVIISNIDGEKDASLVADVRNLPFKAKSLGGIMMQGLTRVPEEIAQAPLERPDLPVMFQPHIMRDDGNMLKLLFADKGGDYSGWTDPEIMNYSQRLAMLKEARRTVEPNGVLIATFLSGGEIRLAKQLGFELTASTISDVDYHAMHYNHGEFLMTLTNLDTPAGQHIETATVAITG